MNHKVPGDGERFPHYSFMRGHNHPLPGREDRDGNGGVVRDGFKWCTIACEHAEWPEEHLDGAASCRTFNAIYCNALKQHVTRNAPCALLLRARQPKTHGQGQS